MSTRTNARPLASRLLILLGALAGGAGLVNNRGTLSSIVIQVCGNSCVGIMQPAPSPSPSPIPSPTPSLEAKQPETIGEGEYLAFVNKAKGIVAAMPTDQSIKFPLGVNYPIRTEAQVSSSQRVKNFAIGYIENSSRQAKLMMPSDLVEMFEQPDAIYGDSKRLSANAYSLKPAAQVAMVAHIIGQAYQEQCGKNTVDLIIVSGQDNKPYVAPCVSLTDIYRDALNAALNGELTRNNYGIDINVLNQ